MCRHIPVGLMPAAASQRCESGIVAQLLALAQSSSQVTQMTLLWQKPAASPRLRQASLVSRATPRMSPSSQSPWRAPCPSQTRWMRACGIAAKMIFRLARPQHRRASTPSHCAAAWWQPRSSQSPTPQQPLQSAFSLPPRPLHQSQHHHHPVQILRKAHPPPQSV